MAKPRTWFERHLAESMKDPEFAAEYREARAEIDAIDALVGQLDAERQRQGMSKAELAKRSGLPAESVRRLFTTEEPDPKLSTIMPLSVALGRPLALPPPTSARAKSARKSPRESKAGRRGRAAAGAAT